MAAFLDSNVLIYSVDRTDSTKNQTARKIVKAAAHGGAAYAISIQTLTEFSNVCLKKLAMPPVSVVRFLRYFNQMSIVIPDAALVTRGVEIKALYGIQYYDAMMVAAAERAGMSEILTEDLGDGQLYCGVRAVNPFK